MLQRASEVAIDVSRVEVLLSTQQTVERDVAWWEHCEAVSKALDSYMPIGCGDPPLALRPFYTDLPALIEELGKGDGRNDTAALFGQWRAHVTDNEARNARHLEVLAGAVQRLRSMRDRALDESRVDDMIREISHFAVSEYRVILPVDLSPRLWSVKQTRRYDVLPGEWRVL
jgi:hypothetical protein